MKKPEDSQFVSSATWRRTARADLWRACVLSCWEVEEVRYRLENWNVTRELSGSVTPVAAMRQYRALQNRLALSTESSRYWGELAVKKTMEDL